MKVLITGWSGTGKSTICRILQARSMSAYDGDSVPGLSGWTEIATGKKLGKKYPADYSAEKYDWNWDQDVLSGLLATHKKVFLCGNANNALQFYGMFTHIFFLSVLPEEQRRRIQVRTDHDYGKDKNVQDMVIERQLTVQPLAVSLGAQIIDANKSPETITDSILRHLK